MKKLSLLVLLVFWSYTWHAYAVGAVGREEHLGTGRSTALKQDLSAPGTLAKIHNKVRFKRRPFIAKDDSAVFEPFRLNEPILPARFILPAEILRSRNFQK